MGADQHAAVARRRGGGQLSSPLAQRLTAAAEAFAPGSAERLVLPGMRSFVCIADECEALCCRAPYRVDLDEVESARLIPLAEIEEHGAVALLAQRKSGACVLLRDDLRCDAYALRPRGCEQYPYLLHFEGADGLGVDQLDAAIEAWADGEGGGDVTPLLMRDLACPGFVGDAISQAEWGELLRWVWGLQRVLPSSVRGSASLVSAPPSVAPALPSVTPASPSVIPAQAGIQAD